MDNAERQGQMSSGFTFGEFLFHHHDILSVYHRIAWFGLKDKCLRAGAITITQTKLKYKKKRNQNYTPFQTRMYILHL